MDMHRLILQCATGHWPTHVFTLWFECSCASHLTFIAFNIHILTNLKVQKMWEKQQKMLASNQTITTRNSVFGFVAKTLLLPITDSTNFLPPMT
jgi:hypothetical protein